MSHSLLGAHHPIGYSDGGGVQDKIKEQEVQHEIEQFTLAQYPELNYHPIALPGSPSDLDLNLNIESLFHMPFSMLNQTTPPFRELLALPPIRTPLATAFSFRYYLYYTLK